jgi:ABC-type spermidine/putrescine transport system permease subunit II
MTILWQFVALLGAHWIGDFICQTHWQASNKSKNNNALARHVASYTAVIAAMAALILPISIGAWCAFVALNGVLHFGTDYVTSRWTSALWAKQDWHNFFVVIGLDQLIHFVTLATTLWLVLR